MAFTGTPTITYLGRNKIRIMGLSLEPSASGTITMQGGGGDVTLDPNESQPINPDRTWVFVNRTVTSSAQSVIISKSTTEPYTITIANPDATNATGELEILIDHGHSLTL